MCNQVCSYKRRIKCVAVCCHCAAVRCSALQCAAVRCSALQCAAVCCSVLQGATVYCSVMQCTHIQKRALGWERAATAYYSSSQKQFFKLCLYCILHESPLLIHRALVMLHGAPFILHRAHFILMGLFSSFWGPCVMRKETDTIGNEKRDSRNM